MGNSCKYTFLASCDVGVMLLSGHRMSQFRLDLRSGMEGVTCSPQAAIAANSIRVMRIRAGTWE